MPFATAATGLLPCVPARSLEAHERHYGRLPTLDPDGLMAEVESSGLRGRGGAWFPTARKLRSVRESTAARRGLFPGRGPVVIANAMEGEPLSRKDAELLRHAPHLVLDGLQAAAAIVGARDAYVAVHRGSPLLGVLEAALTERGSDPVSIEVITPPARYIASEASALAHWTGRGTATPVFGVLPSERGTRGRPTLVQNVETLAHLALIARHGGASFAAVGDPEAPGTVLVTVSGAVARPSVVEVVTGTSVGEIIALAGGLTAPVTGVLTGGYGGAWTRFDELVDAPFTPGGVASAGGAIGAGVIMPLADDVCALGTVAHVARWLAGESAGQCGVCRFGLPSIVDDLEAVLAGDDGAHLDRHLDMVSGRGGCALPDGVVRFVRSGLRVFTADLARHRGWACSASPVQLPAPHPRHLPVDPPGRELS